ncbi:hypothetical protein FA95DRAFT_1613874, partial [Auriscalpium vulgare]
MPTVDVPLDVHTIIMEWIFRLSQAEKLIDRTTLRACALVCRAWTPIAQRLLFRRIRCTQMHYPECNIRLLAHTLESCPHLAAYVRYIDLAWPSYPPHYGSICLRLLELCHNIEGISFRGCDQNNKALSADLDARLRTIQPRPVFLVLVNMSKTICRTIATMFPGARVLVFNDAPYEYDDYHDEDPLPPTVEALEFLELNHLSCSLLAGPLPALRHLCLLHPWWYHKQRYKQLISTDILPQLELLHVMNDFVPPEVLEQLIRLKTLVVGELPEQHVTLPPPLRHARAELAVDPLRLLPELQLVTVSRNVTMNVQTALEAMCRAK